VAAVFAHAVHVGATKQVSSGNNIVTVLTLKLLLKKVKIKKIDMVRPCPLRQRRCCLLALASDSP